MDSLASSPMACSNQEWPHHSSLHRVVPLSNHSLSQVRILRMQWHQHHLCLQRHQHQCSRILGNQEFTIPLAIQFRLISYTMLMV